MTDSLRIYERLKAAEFTEPQAKAIAQEIGDSAESGKKHQENALAAVVNNDIFKAVIERLDQTLKQIEQRLEKLPDRSEIDAKISKAESRLLPWMFGFWVAQLAATVGIIFAAFKLWR